MPWYGLPPLDDTFCMAHSHGALVGCMSLLNLYLAMGGSHQLTGNAMQGSRGVVDQYWAPFFAREWQKLFTADARQTTFIYFYCISCNYIECIHTVINDKCAFPIYSPVLWTSVRWWWRETGMTVRSPALPLWNTMTWRLQRLWFAWAPGSRGPTSLAHWRQPQTLVILSLYRLNLTSPLKTWSPSRHWWVYLNVNLLIFLNEHSKYLFPKKYWGCCWSGKLLWPKLSWKCSIVLLMARIHHRF